MSKHADAADGAERSWRSGRLTRARGAASDATDAQYGVPKPDAIGDFLRERVLDGVFDNQDEECPCGSGEAYWHCHGSSVPPAGPPA
jgi:hypothetical protein